MKNFVQNILTQGFLKEQIPKQYLKGHEFVQIWQLFRNVCHLKTSTPINWWWNTWKHKTSCSSLEVQTAGGDHLSRLVWKDSCTGEIKITCECYLTFNIYLSVKEQNTAIKLPPETDAVESFLHVSTRN